MSSTTTAAQSVYHPADSRGHADHGWLDTYHTFSFAGYYDRDRMNFGVLRVLNDDTVAAGRGFGTHPHDNMEIVSIPLEGDLRHMDSMGSNAVIREGDVQVMSAGTGVRHSEMNANADRPVKFLQIWMLPNARDVEPRYDEITVDAARRNELVQVLSPDPDDEGVWVHQNAWWHIGRFDGGTSTTYELRDPARNGVYAFVLEGAWRVGERKLARRDGLGLWGGSSIELTAMTDDARVLLMEVPMQLP